METNKKSNIEYYSIDIAHIFSSVFKRIWLVILAAVIGAGVGFSIASFAIKPMYASSIMLYVNNSSVSIGSASFSISSSEITAARSLVETYNAILSNRTTLNRVIEKAGVEYTYDDLKTMITSAAVNETEVLSVTVTTDDPYVSCKIANCIAEVLPVRIAEIIEGSSMAVVDSAVVELDKVSPSITNYTAVGMALGAFVALAVLIVLALLDDTVHDEDYITQNFNYPILAKIPDLMDSGSSGYSYYSQSSKKS